MKNETELDAAIESMDRNARHAVLAHVRGGTSAAWLANWLTRAGHPATPAEVEEFRGRDEALSRRDSLARRSPGRH